MKRRPRPPEQDDLLRPRLVDMIYPQHELVKLAALIDWEVFEREWAGFFPSGKGQPATESRLVAGLLYLQHAFRLSDEAVVARWVENPYYQHFTGETFLHHKLPIDRVLHGIDPMTGTTADGVRAGSLHVAPRTATRITSETAYVAAESYIRRTVEYRDAREIAMAFVEVDRLRFEVDLPIRDVLGPDFASSVEGVRRLGSLRNPQGIQSIDFTDGFVRAVFELAPYGEPRLVTLFPIGAN